MSRNIDGGKVFKVVLAVFVILGGGFGIFAGVHKLRLEKIPPNLRIGCQKVYSQLSLLDSAKMTVMAVCSRNMANFRAISFDL